MATDIIPIPNDQSRQVDAYIAIWLQSKDGRSHSSGTLHTYRETITHFRTTLSQVGLDLDGERGTLQTIAQGWAARDFRADLAERSAQVANATYNKRLAALSSFYEFGIGRGWFTANPVKGLERRQTEAYSGAQPMQVEEVTQRLAAIDRSTLSGQRDYVLLFLALVTGRRAMELAGLRVGDLMFIGFSRVKIFWRRTKGGKSHTDTINDQEIVDLLCDYLIKIYGPIQQIASDAALWPSYSNNRRGQPIGYATLRAICEKWLGTTEFHTLRHTFTELMGEEGATIEEKQAALLHSKLETTQHYARRLHGQANPHAGSIAKKLIRG